MTTFTRSAVSVPATRGRPFWFDLELDEVSGGQVNLDGAEVSAILAWGWVRVPATARLIEGVPRLSWSAQETWNMPVSPAPEILVTIVDTSGEQHDILVTVTTLVIPHMSDPTGDGA